MINSIQSLHNDHCHVFENDISANSKIIFLNFTPIILINQIDYLYKDIATIYDLNSIRIHYRSGYPPTLCIGL